MAHQDQLAVFDTMSHSHKESLPDQNNATTNTPLQLPHADLLWTTRIHSTIIHAKIAGDGQGLAVFLEGKDDGLPSPYGVRRYFLDMDDPDFAPYGSTPLHNKVSSGPSTPTLHSLLAPVAMLPPPPLPPPQYMYQKP
eukprot:426659-Ditylum_brightwellii.AAC.1